MDSILTQEIKKTEQHKYVHLDDCNPEIQFVSFVFMDSAFDGSSGRARDN